MASEIRVNRLSNRSGLSTITFANGGVQFSGITTFANGDFRVGTGATILNPSANEMQFHTGGSNRLTINNSGVNLGTGNITAVDATFSGNVSIGKTLTYEDVKNVDSVGVVTARTGVKVTGGDLTVGTAITASSVTGNVTQDVGITTFSGSATWFKGTTANKDMYWSKSSGSLIFKDTAAALFGDSSDLQIYHNGSSSFISDEGQGSLKITTNGTGVDIQKGSSETIARFIADGECQLYHNNEVKIISTTTGITVKDTTASNAWIGMESTDGICGYLVGQSNAGTGSEKAISLYNAAGNEAHLQAIQDKGVLLYYNNSKKIETTSAGIEVTGGIKLNQTQSKINLNTSDGSDNKFLSIHGGGDASQTRGAGISFYGNENSGNEGRLMVLAGNSGNANGSIDFYTGGGIKLKIDSAGQVIAGASSEVILKYTGVKHPHNNNNATLLGNNNIGLINQWSSLNMPMDHSTATASGHWWMLGRSAGTTGEWGLNIRTASANNNNNVWKVVADTNGSVTSQTFNSNGTTNFLKLHRYASVNFVETCADAHMSLAVNGANIRRIMLGDGNASSTGGLALQAGGGSTGFGGGIVMYSHANSTNAGGVYIGKSLNSSGSIILGNGGTAPNSEYVRIANDGKTGVNAGGNAALTSLDIRHHAGTAGTGTKQPVVTICAGRNSTRGLEILTGHPTSGNQNDGGVYYNAKDTESSSYHAQHVWQLGGANAMVLGYTGNKFLGLGTDAPTSKFHVTGGQNNVSIACDNHIRINPNTDGATVVKGSGVTYVSGTGGQSDGNWRDIFTNWRYSAGSFVAAIGDTTVKTMISGHFYITAPNYGVVVWNEITNNNSWNSGVADMQIVTHNTSNYKLQIKHTSYYNTSNNFAYYIMFNFCV